MMDPLHKSKRVYALAAIIAPYLIRMIVAKLGINLPDDVFILIQSGLIEIVGQIIAVVLIFWSKAVEKLKVCK
jgi:hypothetical protein